jgi:hypothetical protein
MIYYPDWPFQTWWDSRAPGFPKIVTLVEIPAQTTVSDDGVNETTE